MSQPLLKVSDLSIEFGPVGSAVGVVQNISFSVEPGTATGIVGESGSGKSVTSLAIMRLLPEPPGRVSSGTIEFAGRDLLKLPKSEMPAIRGRDISMIFQEPMSSLNPVMTIGDQIGEAIKLHETMSREARKQRVVELLKLVGIPDPDGRMSSYPHQFSGGMRQRVMIAMALACNPKLIIADEPTTALDVTIQAQVLGLLNKVRQDFDTSVLLITHDLGVIAEVCEKVIVMYGGRVVEHGNVADIFDDPKHPYTRGLLQAIPKVDDDSDRLYQIPGSVPRPGTVKSGCIFYARCDMRQDRCASQQPPMFDFGPARQAACWVTAENEDE